MITALSFDSVRIQEEGKKPVSVTVDAYLDISIHRRVQLILGGAVRFQNKGDEVPRHIALAELRTAEAA